MCSQIFTEYVDAYIQTILKGQYNHQTIMFVMQEEGKPTSPSVVPHDLKQFDQKAIEIAALHAVSHATTYKLDLIMYSNFENDYTKKEKFSATFACRDGYGNTVHQMYRFDRKKKTVTPLELLPYQNKWVPPVGKKDKFHDPILSKVAAQYAMILAEQKAFDLRKKL